MSTPPTPLPVLDFVRAARSGDLAAFRALVETTREMAYAVAWRVLRRDAEARDVVQDAYLIAFRHLGELEGPEAFAGWLRRIVVRTALNARRRCRSTWLPLDDDSGPPVLDADEHHWTLEQQRLASRALLSLSQEERRICERYYFGGWTAERLAQGARVEPAAMRKRLQRIRERLRKEIEMDEQRNLGERKAPADLPDRIVELLARPRLVDLPENPVAACVADFAPVFAEFAPVDLPEEVDLAEAQRSLGGDAVYIDKDKLQRIDGDRVLRYDLTLPMLLSLRFEGASRLRTAGKAYRVEHVDPMHLEAFHQLELFAAGELGSIDCFWLAGRLMAAVDRVLPGSELRVTPTSYPMCARAFSLDVKKEDDWIEVLAWGEYAAWVLRGIGATPERHVALGAGVGLERLAMLRYGIDDVRKVATVRVSAHRPETH